MAKQKERENEAAPVPNQPSPAQTGCVVTGESEKIETILIIGQIEGHSTLPEGAKATRYEHLLPLLVQAEGSGDVDGVLFLLHTVGGDVEAGLALAEMIAGMKKPTVALVLGGGHSIGIPLAVAADYTVIAPSATMTVHPVRINGLVLGAPQSFDYLARMQDRVVRFITTHSHTSADKLEEWMMGRSDMATDLGTIVEADEAVAGGLCDRVGTFSDAAAELKRRIREKQKR